MLKPRGWLVRTACAAAVLVASVVANVASAAPSDAVVAEQQQVVALVNQQRAEAGLAPLTVSESLTQEAQGYADWMASANFFSHTAPDGSTITNRAEAAGYSTWTYLAENLAAGQSSPERAVTAWMNSPSHRSNILAPDATEIGLGHSFSASTRYGHYWALEFGARW